MVRKAGKSGAAAALAASRAPQGTAGAGAGGPQQQRGVYVGLREMRQLLRPDRMRQLMEKHNFMSQQQPCTLGDRAAGAKVVRRENLVVAPVGDRFDPLQ